MNKRLRRILQPSFRLHFFIMILFVIVSYFFNPYLAVGAAIVTLLLFIYTKIVNRRRQREVGKYIEAMTGHLDSASQSSMASSPMPMVMIRLDSNEVLWANEQFHSLTHQKDFLFEIEIQDLIADFDTKWVMEGSTEAPEPLVIGDRFFKVYGSMMSSDGDAGASSLLGMFYLVEFTELHELQKKYEDSQIIISMIVVDNFEEITKNASYSEQNEMLAEVDRRITRWTKDANGIISRYERDRYLFLFEKQFLSRFKESRFHILDSIREIISPDGLRITLSIGLSEGADTLKESYRQASLALDMALSRGGDQAVIKDESGFTFFGGRTKEMEKRTKVKSRVMANVLNELISESSSILIMGHKTPDLDAVGSACGIVCAARKLGKTAKIVCDLEKTAAMPLVDRLKKNPYYQDVFITHQEALLYLDPKTLLVVVDVSRPEYTEVPELLESCTRIAVIDHHRRSANYIDNAQLNFHEPYASSACELVTELLQYIVDTGDIFAVEAEGLLSGIVLDTKNFSMRTGVRTFEAAAFLRRNGADTIEIKRIFQNDLQNTIERYSIIREAKIYKDNLVVACMKDNCDRVTASQAADELLNVRGIQASFVLYPEGNRVIISARSLGTVNVQIILEKLGGGGHMIQAGAQVPNAGIGEVRARLLQEIDKYLEDNPISNA